MQQMKTTVAIFKDDCDAGKWAAYLDGISALVKITAGEGMGRSLEKLVSLGIVPQLVIISSKLYPAENPELAAAVRRRFPKVELLLVSSAGEPFPPLMPLHLDNVRHLAVDASEADPAERGYFGWLLRQLVEERPLTIGSRLKGRADLESFQLAGSEQKEMVLRAVDEVIAGRGDDRDIFRQRAALLADEMMENALYGAPRDAGGGALYRKGEARELLAGERLTFSFGFDGETLAMEMTDNWGTLDPDLVVEHLARNQADLPGADELGGRGLFLIWRFFDHFHVSVHPGKKTVVGGDLRLSRRLDPEAPKGFHISHLKGGDE